MSRPYRNVWHRPIADIAPGEEGELDLTPGEEAEYLSWGRLEILPLEYEVVGGRPVNGTAPGTTFFAAFTIGQEEHLKASGHIERVLPKNMPAKSASREEWDKYAKKVGLDPDEFSSKDDLMAAVEAVQSGSPPDADKDD